MVPPRLLPLLWAAALCAGADPQPAPEAPFELVPDAFRGGLGPTPHRSFDVVATDVDLDGDPDVLLNWHHLEPLELYLNQEGRFTRADRARGGLDDAPGIASLFGDEPETRGRVRRDPRPGLFVWHDPVRQPTRWHLVWKPGRPALRLVLQLNRPITAVDGLAGGAPAAEDPQRLVVDLSGDAPLEFSVETPLVATRIALELVAAAGAAPPPELHVGGELQPVASPFAAWKPDPHGVAWVDVEGSAHPELYLTRGGLRGELQPPLDPKTDRYFVHSGGAPFYRLSADGLVPPDYARGRSVEWVDADGDGRLELSVSARETANRLLDRGPDAGAFVDRARELGLALEDSEVQLWCDHDGDGRDDLLYLVPPRVHLLRAVPGAPFAPVDGASLGLALPKPGRTNELFERASLRLIDHDLDGDLDLFVLAYGRLRRTLAFRRDGDGYTDVTEALGLAEARSYETAVVLDADNDGYPDLVTLGPVQKLWRSRAGARFEPEVFEVPGLSGPVESATTCDADGDGRTDLVLVGDSPHLLRNAAATDAGWIDVRPRDARGEPIGALVVARYASGRASAQRFGSAHGTAVSQALQPLRFGVPAGDVVEAVEVRWPLAQGLERYAVPAGARELTPRPR